MRLSCISVIFLAGYIHTQGINFGDSSSSSDNSKNAANNTASGNSTSNRIFGLIPGLTTGNTGIDSAINGALIGAGLLGGAGVLTGAINPCAGRRKRQANFGDGNSDNENENSTDTRFFNPLQLTPLCNNNNNNAGGFNNNGGFNSGNSGFNSGSSGFNNNGFNNNNGGFNSGSSSFNNNGFNNNNGGFNSGSSGSNNNGFNNGNTGSSGGSFGSGCNCQCSSTPALQFTSNGITYGNCRTPDETKKLWCYTTGWDNTGCGDLKSSKRYPNNPWSYRACAVQNQCFSRSNRDCKGRPAGDKYYECGCESRKKRQTNFGGGFDRRCAEADILSRTAPTQEK